MVLPRRPPAIWNTYQTQEEEMAEFLSYVPYEGLAPDQARSGNVDVWSPRLASLLVNIGSAIDSTFKTFKDSRHLAAGEKVQVLRQKKDPNIRDYATTYGSIYPLARKPVYFLLDHSPLYPWQSWQVKEPQQDRTPLWWFAYNRVKHDRFANLKMAKLRTAMEALAAFFSVCVLILEMRNHLHSLGRIHHEETYERDDVWGIEAWLGGGPPELTQVQDLGDRFERPVYVNTPLFALFLSSDKNSQDKEELLHRIAPL
jgi:hypothetical protein